MFDHYRVLVVFPDPLTTFSACQILRSRSIACGEASDVNTATDLLHRRAWDLVVVAVAPGLGELAPLLEQLSLQRHPPGLVTLSDLPLLHWGDGAISSEAHRPMPRNFVELAAAVDDALASRMVA